MPAPCEPFPPAASLSGLSWAPRDKATHTMPQLAARAIAARRALLPAASSHPKLLVGMGFPPPCMVRRASRESSPQGKETKSGQDQLARLKKGAKAVKP